MIAPEDQVLDTSQRLRQVEHGLLLTDAKGGQARQGCRSLGPPRVPQDGPDRASHVRDAGEAARAPMLLWRSSGVLDQAEGVGATAATAEDLVRHAALEAADDLPLALALRR